MAGSEDLTLIVGSRAISGWTGVRVSRGIERCPNDFEIEMTERYPGNPALLVVEPGDYCEVLLGKDRVISGYVDRLNLSIDADSHTVHVVGRGKCADLVDCSAEWPGCQIIASTAFSIAQTLVKPYGASTNGGPSHPIEVRTDQTDLGPITPQQNFYVTQTPYELIELACRYAALLAYENADGDLFLTRAGSKKAASGVVQGQNVQSANYGITMDDRFSEIDGMAQSMNMFAELGDDVNLVATAPDPGVTRHRRHVLVAEYGDPRFETLIKRTKWDVARRAGRSLCVHVTVDSWRDADGNLWEPNTIVPVDLPSLKLPDKDWLLTEVSYGFNGEAGTSAELTLMPREAFLPEPILLNPGFADVEPAT